MPPAIIDKQSFLNMFAKNYQNIELELNWKKVLHCMMTELQHECENIFKQVTNEKDEQTQLTVDQVRKILREIRQAMK